MSQENPPVLTVHVRINSEGISSEWTGKHTRFSEDIFPNHRTKVYQKSGRKVFFTMKTKLSGCAILNRYPSGDFPWKNRESHNVPRGRVNDFCPTAKPILEGDFKEIGINGSKSCDYWECTCH